MNINGTIDNIIYRNEENGYTVLLVNDGKTVFTIVGNLTFVDKGEKINCEVTEYDNETYGTQYKLLSYEIELPNEDLDAISKFLLSLNIKGIGDATIKRIVDNFADTTIDTIRDYPERLYGMKGLTGDRILHLRDAIISKSNEIDIVIALSKYSLGPKQIRNIIDEYGVDTLKVIEENPYQMALKVDGIGFVICDNIAKVNGYNEKSEKRVAAGLLYILELEYMKGNVFTEKTYLFNETCKILNLEADFDFNDIIYNLSMDLKIVEKSLNDVEYIFLKKSYNTEKNLSDYLYDRKDNILIITGGPGTGKTYNIKKYLKDALDSGLRVELCAPTGRAAKRINEVTGYEAKTIHRLLGAVGAEDGHKSYFAVNEENPLDVDVLIVDEMSMVDESLMLSLIKGTPKLSKIILVGDVDQLPSVGAGQVLRDMIDSGFFEVKRLTEIHRQGEGSNIVINAHLVNDGQKVDFTKESDDFKFIRKGTEDKIKEAITTLVKENIPKHFDIGLDQIQVICPSKISNCGTESLNLCLQEALNPHNNNKPELKVGSIVFRLNDKIMQTTNNYSIPYDVRDNDGNILDKGVGIFNGDIGEIVDIDTLDRSIVARFDDKYAYFAPTDLKDLSLAYAITVHKSQGSEYDVVIMPMAYAPYKLQNRQILYTAMTRAKKCILFVGIEKYFDDMVKNVNETKRNSALLSKLYIYDI